MLVDYGRHLREESARFATAMASVEPAAPVPSCPDWTAADLLWHLTEVQVFWRLIVDRRATEPIEPDIPRLEDHVAALDRFVHESERLQAALDGADPGEPVWTWSSDQTVGFVQRRQAHEALIHRVDADLTVGQDPPPVDAVFAADGVDEIITVMMTGVPDWATFEPDGSVFEVIASDTDRRWVLATGTLAGTSPDSGKTYTDVPAGEIVRTPPTAIVSGPAVDLDYWLWGRGDTTRIAGEPNDLERLRRLAADATQ